MRLNSDWVGYSRGFGNHPSADVTAGVAPSDQPQAAELVQRDGFPALGTISIAAYTVLIYSQDKADI